MTSPELSTVSPRRRRLLPAIMAFLVIVGVALAADLATKSAAWSYFVADVFEHNGRVILERTSRADQTVIPYGLELTAVANQGAAMGLGQGKQTLFLAVSVVAVMVLIGFFVHSLVSPPVLGSAWRREVYRVTLALLLAGVLGNFYDRLVFGYVRDMLHMLPGVKWTWIHSSLPDVEVFPWVFNLADVYLCVGVGVILVLGILAPESEAAATSSEPERSSESHAASA